MDWEDDQFPPSLPTYQSTPRVIEADMTEAVSSGQHAYYDSSNFLYDSSMDAEFAEFSSQKPSSTALASSHHTFIAPSAGNSSQESSDTSQRDSFDSADGSSGDVPMENGERAPGRVSIPADATDEQLPPAGKDGSAKLIDEPMIGDDLFDFDSAASSPSKLVSASNANPIKMPIRSAQPHGLPSFGYGSYASNSYYHQKLHESSPLSLTSEYHRPSLDTRPQYVPGSLLQNPQNVPTSPQSSSAYDSTRQQTPPQIKREDSAPTLHISDLPKTQRVETQMHVKLTLWPLPEGVATLHFQRYTMARTKLVMNPTPPRSPSMLELYAHCVCATAMEDPEKLRQAYERAAQTARRGESVGHGERSPPRSLSMADDDPQKPINGGFVFICEQCIRRESKRIARKKLKNEEEEESWLEDQPKRIVVFNRAEVLDWQNWRSDQDDGEADSVTPKGLSYNQEFPDEAMQVRFPMRIQCYSRHHGEKLGYRVIFTIKDWQDHVVCQTITNAAIITDDHKAQQSSRPTSEAQGHALDNSNSSFGTPVPQGGFMNHGLTLVNRNSFSTPDLQSLQHSNYQWMPQPIHVPQAFGSHTNANVDMSASRPSSRPPSPSGPSGPQSKRRKGSGNGSSRLRSNLMMTKIDPSSSAGAGAPSMGMSSGPGPAVLQPSAPANASHKGLSASPALAYPNTTPLAPNTSHINSWHHSQSVENLQGHQTGYSNPASAWNSQVPSPESSPELQNQNQDHNHIIESQMDNLAQHANPNNCTVLHKVTPAEGPKSGGVEVTCLGEGFRQGLQVFFGDMAAVITNFYGTTAFVCILPPSAFTGAVVVKVQNTTNYYVNIPPREPVQFTYVDNGEQDTMKLALHLLNQQFSGGTAKTWEVTQKLLSSFGNSSSTDSVSPNPKQHHSEYVVNPTSPSHLKELESMVIRCLEIVDLDENPNRVNLNFCGDNGQAMLHIGAASGFYRLVAGLLARGANPDVRDNNGMTPIHMASLHGHVQIIRKLRSAGADPTIRSLNGIGPAEIASTQEVRTTVEELGYHTRSRSAEATPVKQLSRSSSLNSIKTHLVAKFPTMPSKHDPNLTDSAVLEDDNRLYRTLSETVPQDWSHPRTANQSCGASTNVIDSKHKLNSDAAAFAATPAMSAWRDHMSAQIQQIQQSLHRALPPMLNLPDYQAYPVMRRISNLVPQRGPRAEMNDGDYEGARKLKEVDYGWWDLITGLGSSPPAYDEIYPASTQQTPGDKKLAVSRLMDKSGHDPRSETLHNGGETSTSNKTVSYGPDQFMKHQQQQNVNLHVRKVKRLRSDRRLFFIWIPLLLLIIVAFLRDWAPSIWSFTGQAAHFLADHVQ